VWGWLKRGGLWLDAGLYGLSAVFAGVTASSSTLAPHRAWGAVAVFAYGAGLLVTLLPFVSRSWAGRAAVAVAVWLGATVLPMAVLVGQRAAGRTDRAQEEVLVIEAAGQRLVQTGTPYLSRTEIAALPVDERLAAYVPYQPAMALFGLPRASDPAGAGWSDARVWFLLVTVAAMGAALFILWRAAAPRSALVRGLQVVAVLPVCALTAATGGDDMPVLALCLLGLTLAATGRWGWAGLAVGAAASLKLFAWPVAVVLGVYAVTRARPAWARYGAGALGLPVLTALPVLLAGPGALLENVVAFPFGKGLVTSPAASPLPGHLIATLVPGGRTVAITLVAIAGVGVAAWLVRRPPRTAAEASVVSGIALLAVMLLLPATRFGYLLYPVALLFWATALGPIFRGVAPRIWPNFGRQTRVTYVNRRQAGDVLAEQLAAYARRPDVVVLGLVRGGVPVAARVADALGVPLDVLVVRKLGVPWAPEVAFGAVGPGGVAVHNPEVESRLSPADVDAVASDETEELVRREQLYRRGRAPLSLVGRIAIVVDDGLATGATARAAVAVARHLQAASVVVAVPVGAADSVEVLRHEADEVICPLRPTEFGSVSRFYQSFPQTSDDEVVALLEASLDRREP
jgi:predicted phosphoribosyltransferase